MYLDPFNNDDLLYHYAQKFERELKLKIYYNKANLSTIEITIGKTGDMFLEDEGLMTSFDHDAKIDALNNIKNRGIINDFKVVAVERKLIAICELPKKIRKNSKNGKKMNLATCNIEFDENKSSIVVNDIIIQLPPYKYEYYFAMKLFEHEKNVPIDWVEIYEGMTGGELDITKNTNSEKRVTADTMRRINKRFQSEVGTDKNLVDRSNNTFIRRF